MEKENKQNYLETVLENWTDIFNLQERFISKFVFRGQENSDWELSTSLDRRINQLFPLLQDKDVIPLHEKDMIKEFQWKYPLYKTNGPYAENSVEWLTIMQHYGASTRMLDFTYSIFIALYFAANGSTDGAIWAINKHPMGFTVFDIYRQKENINSINNEDLNKYTIKLANDIITNKSFNNDLEKRLFIIKPQVSNERLSRQQGLFVMPTCIKSSFSDNLETQINSKQPNKITFNELVSYSLSNPFNKLEDISLIKIIIPKRLNYELLKYLRAMNITTEILFPGLEGLAKSLNYARFQFNDKF